MDENAAIIVMCKAPAAGMVKTRLIPFLSPEQAATLAAWFAVDTVLKAMTLTCKVVIAFAPSDGKYLLRKILPKHLNWTEQRGHNLGERIYNALLFAAENECYAHFVVIGTDSPTLPLNYIKQAFSALTENRADVVLGKAEDGGYYLIGMQHPNLSIFQNVEWSSPRTFEQTANNIKNLNLRLHVLPIWYDVDTPEDLRRLREEILNDQNAGQIAPNTAEWLRQNENLF
ncbi:MAG: TIGR04282 family arsenosugar biosynthesis glycosyltransferase [Pyrinomonadaceae bacterium]